MAGIKDLPTLLRLLEPTLRPTPYVYLSIPHLDWTLLEKAEVIVREAEGTTLVLPRSAVPESAVEFEVAWITLGVHSDLAAVGLTAAVATALAQADISCNVVAGFYHDHLLVPYALRTRALDVLRVLAAGG